ncbi:MAG: AMP-binding protein, partial [Cephaloticoccus sp.]|nr:AMP-binding protein [Cephaloticoccus sp.]
MAKKMSITRDWLAERAAVSPAQVGLQIDEQQWTYQELDGLTGRLARQLNRLGVQPGWPVAALMLNSLDYVRLVHAAARTGAILVPLNSRLTIPELEYQ